MAVVRGAGFPPDSVVLESEIPAIHPEKLATETALRTALTGLSGRWSARILCSRQDTWWMVLVEGPQFRWAGFFRDPSEQTAQSVTGRVTRALQRSHLLD
jgi:hypothetical protein